MTAAELEREFKLLLEEGKEKIKDHLAYGSGITDYALYQKQIGVYRGLETAVDYLSQAISNINKR